MLERKWSETAVGLEEGVGLCTGRRCSLKRTLSHLFVSPIYTVSLVVIGEDWNLVCCHGKAQRIAGNETVLLLVNSLQSFYSIYN